MDYIAVMITAPSEEDAARIGRLLVEERLAACCNIIPGVRSIYSWKGELCDDREWLMVLKTVSGNFDALQARVLKLHPYEVPEVIALPISAGSEPYLLWLTENTRIG